ncbi:peptide deformylase [Stella humosa]|uniref:Peptide deformylase n=1 Tax=Stella humosa TaxID=94 RepID=A0A3N1KR57_9PROT|nr:peptide deformylase [Stella humosa]ROP84313.1 peptide deformylase [Stella humosa]BBK33827.1 peptide deformylase [Stella humosa]
MATLPILVAPDPRLKLKAKPVEQIDEQVRTLLDDMLETMYAAPGIGLAAPQIGVSQRLLVLDLAREGEAKRPMKVINPEIVWASDEDSEHNEGCLSLPEHYADVVRPAEVKVRYQDETGETREVHASGLLSTCLQHEMDHLDGVLFVDRISALRRNMILRKLIKARRTDD